MKLLCKTSKENVSLLINSILVIFFGFENIFGVPSGLKALPAMYGMGIFPQQFLTYKKWRKKVSFCFVFFFLLFYQWTKQSANPASCSPPTLYSKTNSPHSFCSWGPPGHRLMKNKIKQRKPGMGKKSWINVRSTWQRDNRQSSNLVLKTKRRWRLESGQFRIGFVVYCITAKMTRGKIAIWLVEIIKSIHNDLNFMLFYAVFE